MDTTVRTELRRRLEDRRARLHDAISTGGADELVTQLLDQVDQVLSSFDTGAYGTCLICNESVTDHDLVANPLLEYCLCGLTASQQRALEHDLGLARRLQAGLLPPLDLAIPGWTSHYRYEPAGVVSGDYCDLWIHPDDPDAMFFAVADVSGKGVAASLLMAHIQAAFRSLLGAGVPLDEVVERVNRQLLEASLPTHYATLACGRATAGGRIELVNAGHCPPLIVRDAGVETLGATGLPVGVLDGRLYGVTTHRLGDGDTLLLYTDGLTEARGPNDDEYACERLERAVAGWASRDPRTILRSIREDLAEFVGAPRLQDDLTMLALRCTR